MCWTASVLLVKFSSRCSNEITCGRGYTKHGVSGSNNFNDFTDADESQAYLQSCYKVCYKERENAITRAEKTTIIKGWSATG